MSNALRKSRKTSATTDHLHDVIHVQVHACEARCLALALDEVEMYGQKFRFCHHHAERVRAQLSAQVERAA